MTDIWGPPFWETLHFVSFSYPLQPTADDIRSYFAYYNSVSNVLPCPLCREHMKAHIKKHPIEYALANGRPGLVRWVIDIHNEVNKSLKKDEMTYDEVIELYMKKMHLQPDDKLVKLVENKPESDSYIDIMVIGGVLLLAGYLLAQNR